MLEAPLYPLRFEPILKSPRWGGRRLASFLDLTTTNQEPIGEAWMLSDVDGNESRVANGPLTGTTLRELLAADASRILGSARLVNGRFPLLFKFIDAKEELSVQVHPNDAQAAAKRAGMNGKTEAWVVLESDPATSRIYAGTKPGLTAADFRAALASGTVPSTLHSVTPGPGDCFFLEAGTVHAIGADILLFEVQQTSDITYRLYDWDRKDPKTGQPRELHVEEGLACVDFQRGPCDPVQSQSFISNGRLCEWLVESPYFSMIRHPSQMFPFPVGAHGQCRILTCVEGKGELEFDREVFPLKAGDLVLLPSKVGQVTCRPQLEITLLECGLP